MKSSALTTKELAHNSHFCNCPELFVDCLGEEVKRPSIAAAFPSKDAHSATIVQKPELTLEGATASKLTPTPETKVQPVTASNSTVPNCRAMLNEYCQKHAVYHRDEFIEDHSTGKPLFKCTITCLLDGIKIVQDSGQWNPRKDDAKEVAAHKILVKIKEREKSRSCAATATVPTNMVWKSQLKEHYDKQGEAGIELKYTVTEMGSGDFVSSVFVKELGREVRGEKARSKKQAEQNAAKKAIELLSKK